MDNQISTDVKVELVRVLGIQYRQSSKMEKARILGQFIAASGYHRKHAIRLLKCEPGTNPNQSNPSIMKRSRRIYDEAVKDALFVLWEAADRICGKRLKAILPSLVDAMERHGHLNLNPDAKKQLLKVSAETIDRLLYSIFHPDTGWHLCYLRLDGTCFIACPRAVPCGQRTGCDVTTNSFYPVKIHLKVFGIESLTGCNRSRM